MYKFCIKNKRKCAVRILSVLTATTAVVSCVNLQVFADDTNFDAAFFENLFKDDISDNNEYNIIGNTGAVRPADSTDNISSLSGVMGELNISIDSAVDLRLLSNAGTVTLDLYNTAGIEVTSVPVNIKNGYKGTVQGLTDGEYTYKVTVSADSLLSVPVDGTCTVKNNTANITLLAMPTCTLNVIDTQSTGKSFEFSNVTGVTYKIPTFGTGDSAQSVVFAVSPVAQYKVRWIGETNYNVIEIPAMATEITYDLSEKQISFGTNDKVQEDATLPGQENKEENPFNIPPTYDYDDTVCVVDQIDNQSNTVVYSARTAGIILTICVILLCIVLDTVSAIKEKKIQHAQNAESADE